MITLLNKIKRFFKRIFRKNGRISEDCWDLDIAFYKWLNEHLKVYKEEASRMVDLDYFHWEYKGKTWSQGDIIDELIRLSDLLAKDEWLDKYPIDGVGPIDAEEEAREDLCNLWFAVLPTMWW